MTLGVTDFGDLAGGVSQQADTKVGRNQFRECTNTWVTLINGLTRRPSVRDGAVGINVKPEDYVFHLEYDDDLYIIYIRYNYDLPRPSNLVSQIRAFKIYHVTDSPGEIGVDSVQIHATSSTIDSIIDYLSPQTRYDKEKPSHPLLYKLGLKTATKGYTTYIVNTNTPVSLCEVQEDSENCSDTRKLCPATIKPNVGIIYIEHGVNKCRYQVWVIYNDSETLVADVTTPSTDEQEDIMDSSEIAEVIATGKIEGMTSSSGGDLLPDGWISEKNLTDDLPSEYKYVWGDGSVIRIIRPNTSGYNNNVPFTLKVSDGYSDTAMRSFVDTVGLASELPPRCFAGIKVKVNPNSQTNTEAYYLVFIPSGEKVSDYTMDELGDKSVVGEWRETVGWSSEWKLDDWPRVRGTVLLNRIDKRTMPLEFTFVPKTKHFTIEQPYYEGRMVGNDVSAPMPSFVSEYDEIFDKGMHAGLDQYLKKKNYINNVLFHGDRLVFLSENKVIMSRVGDYRNFFPYSAATISPNDPIDIINDSDKRHAQSFLHGFSFGNNLYLVCKYDQFYLTSRGAITPQTIKLSHVSHHEMSTVATPFKVENSLIFCDEADDKSNAVPNGKEFATIKELYVDEGSVAPAIDLTAHVQKYIPNPVLQVISSDTLRVIVVLPVNSRCLYIYQYRWDNRTLVKSAWQKWTFENLLLNKDVIHNITFFGSSLLFLSGARMFNIPILDDVSECSVHNSRKENFTTKIVFHTRWSYRKRVQILSGRYQLIKMSFFSEPESAFKVKVKIKEYNERVHRNSVEVPRPDTGEFKVPINAHNRRVEYISIESEDRNSGVSPNFCITGILMLGNQAKRSNPNGYEL